VSPADIVVTETMPSVVGFAQAGPGVAVVPMMALLTADRAAGLGGAGASGGQAVAVRDRAIRAILGDGRTPAGHRGGDGASSERGTGGE
jgi:hypothetical protein